MQYRAGDEDWTGKLRRSNLLPVAIKTAVIREKSAAQLLPEHADLNVILVVPLA